MSYNPEIHHRRSIRLKGYDYSKQGDYSILFVIINHECLFGNVVEGKMVHIAVVDTSHIVEVEK